MAGGRGSRGGRRRDFKNLNVQAAPGPISLAFLGVGLSVNCFLKLARWFQCAAEMALNYLHWWLLLRLWDPGGGAPNRSGWCNGKQPCPRTSQNQRPGLFTGSFCGSGPTEDPLVGAWGTGGPQMWWGRCWLIFPLPLGGHSQESPPGGCERLWIKEQGCHLMEELDRMATS